MPFIDKIEVLRETDKAFLIWFEKFSLDRWVPKSQMRGVFHPPGYKGSIDISSWLWDKLKVEFQQAGQTNTDTGSNQKKEEDVSMEEGRRNSAARTLYRKLAAKYHPDVSPETAEVMRDINELWQLCRPDRHH